MKELSENSVCKNSLHTASAGKIIKYHNLEAIIDNKFKVNNKSEKYIKKLK